MSFLFEISIILAIATLLGFIAKTLKQPLILAYIATGIIISPAVLNAVQEPETITMFSEFGVALLLFMVGLNMNLKSLKEIGLSVIKVGVGQVAITAIAGYLIATSMGFDPMESFYICVALTFGSTIIVVKLLSDKSDIDSLYGRIAVGILLVQDFVAIVILLLLTGLLTNRPMTEVLSMSLLKGSALFTVAFVFHKIISPRTFDRIAKSRDLLFMSGISWCFVMAAFANYLGFSMEVGAFLAGLSLATNPYHYELGGRIKPLRDFFLVLFFVVLGTQVMFVDLGAVIVPSLILSAFVLIGHPLIVMVLLGAFGFKKRTGFLSGTSLAQISEFSLIIAALGISLGHLSQGVSSMITLIGIITITISSYFIGFNKKVFHMLEDHLSVFERNDFKEDKLSRTEKDHHYDIVLVGCHRMGYNILRSLKDKKFKTLVIDFNPDVIKKLIAKGYHCLYGDSSDPEIIRKIKSYTPSIIISTVPYFEDNLMLIRGIKDEKNKPIIFLTSTSVDESMELYREGADYVVLPHFLGGEKTIAVLDKLAAMKFEDVLTYRLTHIKELKKHKDMFG